MKTAKPSEFECVRSIIRPLLVEIISGLLPDKQAEAIEVLEERGIRFTPEQTTIPTEGAKS